MATNKMNKEFQKRIKVEVDPEEHAKRVRQKLIEHKYGGSRTTCQGKESKDGNEK